MLNVVSLEKLRNDQKGVQLNTFNIFIYKYAYVAPSLCFHSQDMCFVEMLGGEGGMRWWFFNSANDCSERKSK